ncbi:MAG: thioredoxin domain-containing protein [Fibrella sp.]|nr:thioredoxin domain-containing protein [Armatimonadota bacterium]
MSMSPTETEAPETPSVPTRRKSGMTGETKFMIAALLVIALGGGAMFALNQMTNPPPVADAPPAPAVPVTAKLVDDLFAKARHQKGEVNATLTFVEFADFECPSCRTAYKDSIAKMEKAIPSFRLGFMHLPLPMHERAIPAAVAAEAAAKQGKFWEMYAVLFDAKSEGLNEKELVAAATSLGLDMPRFAADRKNEKPFRDMIDADMKVATENRVDSTPTFFIHDKAGNTATLSGAGNLSRLFPDLKDGVLGNDKIDPLPEPGNGVPITMYLNGKREER